MSKLETKTKNPNKLEYIFSVENSKNDNISQVSPNSN
jgi:hypothetical protein